MPWDNIMKMGFKWLCKHIKYLMNECSMNTVLNWVEILWTKVKYQSTFKYPKVNQPGFKVKVPFIFCSLDDAFHSPSIWSYLSFYHCSQTVAHNYYSSNFVNYCEYPVHELNSLIHTMTEAWPWPRCNLVN